MLSQQDGYYYRQQEQEEQQREQQQPRRALARKRQQRRPTDSRGGGHSALTGRGRVQGSSKGGSKGKGAYGGSSTLDRNTGVVEAGAVDDDDGNDTEFLVSTRHVDHPVYQY
jgi:hypothetical protein